VQFTKDATGQKFLEQLRKFPCYAGLDLAAVADLTAFVMAWEIDGRIYTYPFFYLPKDDITERCKRDGVPYITWSDQGFIHLTPGSVTDWRYVVSHIKELSGSFNLKEVAFDKWGARDVVRELMDGGITCIDTSQNVSSLTAPTK
jgi:phage terminase large subunit-like protein